MFQAAGGAGSPVQMYVQILQSDSVMRAVAGEVGMGVRALRGSVEVEAEERARIVRIAVRSREKERSVRIAELLLERMQHEDGRLKLAPRTELQTTIRDAVTARGEDLAASEAKLQRVREKGYVGGEDAQRLMVGVKERRVELESVGRSLEDLRAALAKTIAGIADLPENVGPSPSLRKELEEAQLQLALVRLRHGDDAPEFVTAQERVELLEKRLREQLEGYARTIQAGVADSQPGTVMETLTDLTVRRAALETEIAAWEQVVTEYPDQARQVEALTTRVQGLRELVATLETRYELARIEAVNDPNRWEVLDDPYALDDPVNKRYVRSGLTGLLLGVLLGMVLAVARGGGRDCATS